jgi:hypothetical protein
MSRKPDKEQTPELEEEQTGGGGILLWLLLGILLVMLLGGGLAIASFLGLFSVDGIVGKARQLPEQIGQIRQMPVVAKYYPVLFPEKQTDPSETEAVSAPVTFPPQPTAATVNPPQPVLKQAPPPPTPEAIAKAKAEEDKKISRLARLYANMKPEEAAPIMKELDDDLVVSILFKMEDDQAARVLAVIEPQRAAKLTRLLAGKQKVIIAVQ